MGAGDKCCVGGCDNDRRYPGKYHVRSHVQKLGFHKPSNSEDAIKPSPKRKERFQNWKK